MVYSLTCNVTKTVDGLINSPTATWTTEGVAVLSGNGITVSTIATRRSTISTLTFDPLRTSHSKEYRCDGILTSQALNEPLTPSMMVDLSVQSTLYIHVPILILIDYQSYTSIMYAQFMGGDDKL